MGTAVTRVARLRLADGVPLVLETLHVPVTVAPDLTGELVAGQSIPRPARAAVRGPGGRRPADHRGHRAGRGRGAAARGTGAGGEFLCERLLRDLDGRAVAFVRSLHRADHYQLTVDCRRWSRPNRPSRPNWSSRPNRPNRPNRPSHRPDRRTPSPVGSGRAPASAHAEPDPGPAPDPPAPSRPGPRTRPAGPSRLAPRPARRRSLSGAAGRRVARAAARPGTAPAPRPARRRSAAAGRRQQAARRPRTNASYCSSSAGRAAAASSVCGDLRVDRRRGPARRPRAAARCGSSRPVARDTTVEQHARRPAGYSVCAR